MCCLHWTYLCQNHYKFLRSERTSTNSKCIKIICLKFRTSYFSIQPRSNNIRISSIFTDKYLRIEISYKYDRFINKNVTFFNQVTYWKSNFDEIIFDEFETLFILFRNSSMEKLKSNYEYSYDRFFVELSLSHERNTLRSWCIDQRKHCKSYQSELFFENNQW